MAPNIHPACTPSASCQPVRCHPTGPPCQNPHRCLSKSRKKGNAPCESAISVITTQSANCRGCGRGTNPRSVKKVEDYIRRKNREEKLQQIDWESGTDKLGKYRRRRAHSRSRRDCCAGHGHRGRLRRRWCSIL